ncbi:hypothetical protein QW71_02980 [Paenibacillus sp. IHB B 3415]|uniref:sensor histidine kinase n=1 Tax=Paenibacillus sp. IHB B 3415 TaxID=867080 RepID=UPI00057440A3|nr:sensor histidine kinase [Paenibacillus sp. IHB B 3415]KHL97138.1 hypothetical protein QW71_02980 [Paenibacillus sp. IHB B 3415]
MKIFVSYLYDNKKSILLWIIFGALNFFLGFLYRIPTERTWLWVALCCIFGGIAGGYDFFKYHSRHTEMALFQKQIHLDVEKLPRPESLLERDYYNLLKQMSFNLKEMENSAQQNEQNVLDYYTLWVHQIKIPIAALRLILQDEECEAAEEMNVQLFKIEQYVELVLQYLRLESPSTDYRFQETELNEIICEAVKKYAPLFIRKRLPLYYETVHCRVLTDSKWLGFVLEQVLSNALKYTKEGSISIYLENSKTLVVEDTGIGINPEDLPRVGERSFTGYMGRQDRNATGLGLYLCKTILSKLGHSLSIESEPGKGTKVIIGLNSVPLEAE